MLLTAALGLPAAHGDTDPEPTLLDAVGNSATVIDEVGNPTTSDDGVTLSYTIGGRVLDHQDNPVANALVSLESPNQSLIEFTTSDDGQYSFPDLGADTYTLIALLEGYVFKPTQVTVGEDTASEVTVDLQSSVEPISVDNAIVVGKHGCGDNTVAMNTPVGELIHGFDSGFTAKGIYLRTLYFDDDSRTDIAIGEFGQGKDVFIFDANKKQIGSVLTNGDDKGVHVAFGDVDADQQFEIAVTNQSPDKQVNLYQHDGKAIRPLKLFDSEVKLNIAIGDVNGDQVAELIVAMAEPVAGDNVFVFDQHGNQLSSFAIQLPTGSAAFQDIEVEHLIDQRRADTADLSSALVVTTGDTDGDGTDEILVGQAGEDLGYGVAILDLQGTVKKQFYAFTGMQNGNGNLEACGDDGYQGHGVVIAAGDVDGNGKANVIAARAGGTEVRVFDTDGAVQTSFVGASGDDVVTGVAFGEKMAVETEEVTEVEPEETLENTRVVGKPGKPAVLDGNTIQGTVQVSNAVIVKVKIKTGAHLKIGPGVRFKTRAAIPPGIDLSNTFSSFGINTRADFNLSFKPLDLSTNVVEDEPPVLDDIKVLVGDNALEQRQDNGNLTLEQDDMNYELCPVQVLQAEDDAPDGIRVADDGSIRFVTRLRQEIITQPVAQDFAQFVEGLADILIGQLNMDLRGQLTAKSKFKLKMRYSAQADFFSIKIQQKLKLGINFIDAPDLARDSHDNLAVLVFMDRKKQLRQQILFPMPAQMDVLKNLVAERDSNVAELKLDFGGKVSFKMKGKKRKGIWGYEVVSGEPPASGGVEFQEDEDINGDGLEDITVVYPNGDRQSVMTVE